MRLTDISATQRGLVEHGHGVAEPIGLEYVCAALEAGGFTAKWLGECGLVIEQSERERALVLLSAMTWEFADVCARARRWKDRGAVTILGGYHACGYDGRIATDAFDYVILGEGERTIIDLVQRLDGDLGGVPERSIVGKGPVVIRSPRIKNLDELPWPTRVQHWLERYKLHDLMWPAPSQQKCPSLVLASRGCAYSVNLRRTTCRPESGRAGRSGMKITAEA